jgi:PAS domain S-box-containing protein
VNDIGAVEAVTTAEHLKHNDGEPRTQARAVPSTAANWLRARQGLLTILLPLALALVAGGYLLLSRVRADARAAAHEQLSAIADLKLHEISSWREERLADARFFSSARFVAADLRRLTDEPASGEARSAVRHWLGLLKGGDRYAEVIVTDVAGNRLEALPDSAAEPDANLRSGMEAVLRTREVAMTDLHRDDSSGRIELEVVFPVFENADRQGGELLAVVLLKVDAGHFLFPLLRSWPTPSRTAETLLVRREGDEVRYLNAPRHRPDAPLTLLRPMNAPDLPAAKVLRGDRQVFDGEDYRGVPVVAVGRLLPGTPWAMEVKIDRAEVYAPLRQRAFMLLLILALALLAGALLVGLLWRRQNTRFLQRELALEKERVALAERVAHLMRNANDIILLVSPDGRILEANHRAIETYGFELPELRQKRVRDLRTPEAAAQYDLDLARVNSQGDTRFETVHQRRDGSAFVVEVSSRKVEVGGGHYILSIIRDITQRKAHEREIERLNRLYLALSQVNEAVVRADSRDRLLREVCRALVESGGFEMAWIGWVDEASSAVVPVASFGDGMGYLDGLRVFADDRPEGQGPTGRAIREGRPCVCNDIEREPSLLLWREAIARSGWRAVAAFPIRQEARIRGALVVYSRQEGFFGPQERGLVEEAANDVSFGLDALLKDQHRREAEEAVRTARDELSRANAELERRVQERTAQLRESIAELEAFSYSLSHDLRSPLRAINSFSTMVLEEHGDKLGGEGRGMLEKVVSAARRMDQLMTDVLTLSQVSRIQIQLEPVDVERLLGEILRERPELQAPRAGVRIERPLAPVLGHEPSLTQVLTNLLGNAVKFVAPGVHPSVRVWTAVEGERVRLWVADNGIGIPAEAREKIFGMFQRLHSQKTYEGTGIGLAIVKKAVERMGGRLGVESEPGRGSRFWVELRQPPPPDSAR